MSDFLKVIKSSEKTGIKKLFKHLIAVLVFIAVACVYCSPVFSGKKISAHDTNQWKGMAKEVNDHRHEYDEEPLWTNAMFSGMPTYQVAISFPKNLIKKLDIFLKLNLPHPAGTIFKYMFGFYILLIALKVPWKYAIAGSLAFAFSTYFMIILEAGHNTKAKALSYVAPMIAGVILSYRGKYLIGGSISALFLSLNIVSNHVQITYYAGLCILLLGLTELITSIRKKQLKRFAMGTIVSFGALILALLVNNTNLRLTNDYVKDSQRGKSRLEIKARKAKERDVAFTNSLSDKKLYATRWSYGVQESLTLLVPDFSGGGSSDAHKSTKTYKEIRRYLKNQNPYMSKKQLAQQAGKQTGSILYWGDQPGVNGPVYLGSSIILLFFLGLLLVKSEYKWWLLCTAILGLLISYGKNSLGFFNFMFDYFPFYDKFRAVTIGMVITELAVPLLGFIFLKELLLDEIDKQKVFKVSLKVIATLSGLLVVFYLFGSNIFEFTSSSDAQIGKDFADIVINDRISIFKADVGRSLLFVLLTGAIILVICKKPIKHNYMAILLGVICLADLYPVSSRYLNESSYERKDKVEKPFKIRKANTEIFKDKSNYRVFNISGGVGNAINDASTSYFHPTIGGYSSVKLMIYQDLLDFSLGSDMQSIALGLRDIQKKHRGIPKDIFNQLCSTTNLINMLNTKYIIVNKDFPPLINDNAFGNAWFVREIKTYNSPDSVMFNLPVQNIKKIALAESSDVTGLEGKVYNTDGKIELSDYKSNHLTYNFSSKEDAYVVFSEIHFKGWEAFIDGQPVNHNKVNYALRGLEIPRGEHRIEFKFRSTIYDQGEKISLFASLSVLGLFFLACFKSFKKLNVL